MMKRNPSLVDSCRVVILEKLIKVQKELQDITLKYNGGTNSWLNIWCPKKWYPLQCDFSAMLSPKWFDRFVLPDLITQSESLDYAIYHLDGPDELKYLDTLLKVPSIHGIQWVPGAGKDPMCSESWYPVYRKIEAAGKKIVADCSPELLLRMYNTFNPKQLFLCTTYLGELYEQFLLPEFMGGMGGKDDEE
jgi:5-methyltetrahydrofolate--homocysteine methyltransferase